MSLLISRPTFISVPTAGSLGLTAVDLNPVLIAATVVFGGLAAALARTEAGHANAGDAAKKHGDAEKDAAKESKDAVEDLERQATSSYSNMLSQLQVVTAEMLKQVAAQKDLQRAKDEFESAKLAGQIATLDEQENRDLAGKDAGQQEAIKQSYDRKRLEVRQKFERERAEEDLQDKRDAVAAAEAALQDQNNKIDALRPGLTQAWRQQNGAAAAAVTGIGVKSDAQVAADRLQELNDLGFKEDGYGNTRGLTGPEQGEYADLQASVPKLQQTEKDQGPTFDDQLASLKDQLTSLNQDRTDSLDPTWKERLAGRSEDLGRAASDQVKIAKIKEQILAIENYTAQTKAAAQEIKENVPKFQELNAGLAPLSTAIVAAKVSLLASQTKLSTLGVAQTSQIEELHSKQEDEAIERAYTDREAARQKTINELEAKLKAIASDPSQAAQRTIYEESIANYSSAGIRDKAISDLRTGKIDRPQYQEQMSKAQEGQANADSDAKAHAQKSALDQQRKETSDLKRQVEELKKEIAARPDHKQLEPIVARIEAIMNPVQEIPQLMTLLAGPIERIDAKTSKLAGDVHTANDRIRKLEGAVRSSSNNHRN